MADVGESSSRQGKEKIDDLLSSLTLHGEEEGDFMKEEEIKEPPAVTNAGSHHQRF